MVITHTHAKIKVEAQMDRDKVETNGRADGHGRLHNTAS